MNPQLLAILQVVSYVLFYGEVTGMLVFTYLNYRRNSTHTTMLITAVIDLAKKSSDASMKAAEASQQSSIAALKAVEVSQTLAAMLTRQKEEKSL